MPASHPNFVHLIRSDSQNIENTFLAMQVDQSETDVNILNQQLNYLVRALWLCVVRLLA